MVVLTDSNGQLIYESRGGTAKSLNVTDRDYFQAHRANPLLGLLITGPYQGPYTQGPVLALSRRVSKQDGSFAGVAAGSIKLDALRRLFSRMNAGGAGGGVTLFSLDGRLLLREPELGSGTEMIEKSALFRLIRASSTPITEGILPVQRSAIDGQRRVVVYRRIGGLPLGIAYAVDEAEAYAGWARRAALIGTGLAILAGLATVLAWGLARELGRRSRAERAAVESAGQVQLLTDNSSDMITRVDWDGMSHYVSPASIAVLGRLPAELVGRHWLEFVEADDQASLATSLLDLKLDGRFPVTVVKIRQPGGDVRHVEAQGRALPDGTGAILAVRDITERIQMEQRLRQSHRMEALGQLTAGVAHDFNNMLQAQLGCLEMLIDELPGLPGPRRLAQQALQLGERGARLTNQLLSFSRQQILFPEPIMVNDFLGGLTETLRRTMGPNVRVLCTVHAETPPLFADRAHLESALLNLSLNARDAMPGGGTIRIEASGEPGPTPRHESTRLDATRLDNRVVINVHDEGVGMEPAILERACEPFFTTKGLNGTGLGLASVLGFVTQSGGTLDIQSVLGKGTMIRLALPRATEAAEDEPEHEPATAKGGRLLVVDDTPEVLFAVTATLESGGFEVIHVPSPALALRAVVEDGPFDCLITDYAMPLMNGGELVRQAQLLCPGLPALIITGWADVETLERLDGAAEILRKPFKRDALLLLVSKLITETAKQPRLIHLIEEN